MDQRVVFVTGGSKGIGLGIAMAFARAGYAVSICGRSTVDLDNAASIFIGEKLPEPLCVKVDVSDASSCQRGIETLVKKYGRLDVLCANAGIFPSGSLEQENPKLFDHVFSVNVFGTICSVQASLPELKKSAY